MTFQNIHGVDVPALGLGTYRLTGSACQRGIVDALEIGYRHLDTAQVYGNETDVGRGIRDAGTDRDDLFLTTKIWMDNLSPARVRSSVEESLSKLQTDYVDLLLIHWPTQQMDLRATLDAMLELKEDGKTHHVGVSNFPPDLMRRALSHAPIFCNQVEYHPYLDQSPLLTLSRTEDVLLTAYSPIARGRVMEDPALQAIAAAYEKTPAQVALRWLLQQDHVAAIPKASSPEHRRQNVEVFDFELSTGDMQRISGLARGTRLVDPSWAPTW